MKKYSKALLLLLMLFTLCFGFAFGACKDTPSQEEPSQEEPSQPEDPDEPEDPDDPTNPEEPDDPDDPEEPIDLGVFARVWYAAGGIKLDLVSQTCEYLPDFKVSAITGEYADTVIQCTADGNDYELKLNDGKLEMSGGSSTIAFYADASEFGGSWQLDDEWSYIYYSVSSDFSNDGYYAWDAYSLYGGDCIGYDGKAVTSFMFDEEGNVVVKLVDLEWGYDMLAIYYDENGVLTLVNEWGYVYAITPYVNMIATDAVYLDEQGNRFDLEAENNTVTVNGVSAAYTAAANELGGGLSFSVEGEEYSLQMQLDRIVLVSSNGVFALSHYNPEAIKGSWSDSTGVNTLNVTKDDKVTFNGTEYDLTAYSQDGEICYEFKVGGTTYTIVPIKDVDVAVSVNKDGKQGDYYIRDEVKEVFVGIFENGLETLTVDSDFKVTNAIEEESFTAQGRFIYSEELGCVALVYNDPDAGNLYLVKVDEAEAIFWTISSDGYPYSSYFDPALFPEMEKLFTAGLESGTDYYTTGGSEAQTLSFDFEAGVVVYNGEKYAFVWSYDTNGWYFYPTIMFVSGSEDDFIVHTIQSAGLSVAITSTDWVNLEENFATFISQTIYEEILGSVYIYRGPLYDERFELNDDGELFIDSTDLTSSDKAVSPVSYDYMLQRDIDLNGREDIMIGFNPEGVGDYYLYIHIIDRDYAMMFDIVYSRSELIEYIGTYYNGAEAIELTAQGGIKVNGSDANVLSVAEAANTVTVVYSLEEKTYTAVFAKTTATIEGKIYQKRIFTPEAFVGTYSFETMTIVISASALTANIIPELTVTVEGDPVDFEFSFTEDGKQQISFTCIVFGEDWSMVTVKYTVLLDGDKLTIYNETSTQEFNAASWNYGEFIFDEEQTLTDSFGDEHSFVCLSKEDGTVPLYLYDGEVCSNYEVSVDESGAKTLQVTCGEEILQIVVSQEGSMTVDYKPSAIPLPPPPPPAPPLP